MIAERCFLETLLLGVLIHPVYGHIDEYSIHLLNYKHETLIKNKIQTLNSEKFQLYKLQSFRLRSQQQFFHTSIFIAITLKFFFFFLNKK